jgi:hypothetical protein
MTTDADVRPDQREVELVIGAVSSVTPLHPAPLPERYVQALRRTMRQAALSDEFAVWADEANDWAEAGLRIALDYEY